MSPRKLYIQFILISLILVCGVWFARSGSFRRGAADAGAKIAAEEVRLCAVLLAGRISAVPDPCFDASAKAVCAQISEDHDIKAFWVPKGGVFPELIQKLLSASPAFGGRRRSCHCLPAQLRKIRRGGSKGSFFRENLRRKYICCQRG